MIGGADPTGGDPISQEARVEEKKLMTLVNLGTAVMILILAGAFTAVIRAALSVAAH